MDSADEILASQTRRGILERLSEKNHRPSDLSRELGKDKSTIVEHLDRLQEAGLVERLERDGHKWIFYRLSRDGEAYFPNRRKRAVFFLISMVSLIGAMISMFMYFQPSGLEGGSEAPKLQSASAPEGIVNTFNVADNRKAEQPAAPSGDIYMYAAAALLAVFAAAGAQALLVRANVLAVPKR